MKKLVALEQIKGLCTRIIYAEKYDELELVREDIGVSCYRNKRTGELLHCRNDRTGMVDSSIMVEFADKVKKQHVSVKGNYSDKQSNNQLDLFQ